MTHQEEFPELLEHPCYPRNFTKLPISTDICGNRTFCNLKFQIPTPAPRVHATLNGFGCMDLAQCESTEQFTEAVIARFCSLPSCTVFQRDSSERQLCMIAQTVGCALENRYLVRDDFLFSAMCAISDDELSQQSKVISSPDNSLINALVDTKQIVSPETMDSIIQCGVGYANDLPSLFYSGAITGLGSFQQCIRHHESLGSGLTQDDAAYKYCTVEYDMLAHRGVCIPNTCEAPQLYTMLNFICDQIRPDERFGYRGGETCLDYLDVIPLNTCLITQLMGCNETIAGADQSNFDLTALFMSGDSSKRRLYDWTAQMPSLGTQSFAAVVETVRDVQQKIFHGQPDWFIQPPRMLSEPRASEIHDDGWFDTTTDTIPNYRFESPLSHKFRVRCGGWFAPLDDSDFNKTAGVLTALLIFMLPFYPFALRRSRGWGMGLLSLGAVWLGNLRKNLSTVIKRGYKLGSGDFAHICGFRALNMIWVVVGHTFTFSWQEGVDHNLQQTLQLVHDYNFQVVLSGQLAVDSFFFIAGLMFGLFSAARMETLCLKLKERGATPTILLRGAAYSIKQSLRRYLRLMPTTAVVLAASYWIIPYLWNGPMWVSYVDYVRYGQQPNRDGGCYTQWWKVLLMISNLDIGGLSCMGHTWYLANDFQFYVLSNLVVLVSTCLALGWCKSHSGLKISRKPLYIAVGSIYLICSAYSYRTVIQKHLHFAVPAFSDSSLSAGVNDGSKDILRNWEAFYVKPWCRIGPYIIGLLAGIVYRDKQFEHFITSPAEPIMIDDSSPVIRKALQRDENDSPVTRRREAPETPRPSHPYQDVGSDFDCDRRLRPDVFVIYTYSIAALVVAWICVFTMPYYANKGTKLLWNETLDRIWFVFNKTIWALSCAWFALVLVYVPKFGRRLRLLKPIRSVLSCRPMALCSIFTFTFYLVHPFVQQVYYAHRTTDVTLTNLTGWFATVAHFVLTCLIGVLTCIMVEMPLGYVASSFGF